MNVEILGTVALHSLIVLLGLMSLLLGAALLVVLACDWASGPAMIGAEPILQPIPARRHLRQGAFAPRLYFKASVASRAPPLRFPPAPSIGSESLKIAARMLRL